MQSENQSAQEKSQDSDVCEGTPFGKSQILRGFQAWDGEVFEPVRLGLQALTFEQAQCIFKRDQVDFSKEVSAALSQQDNDDQECSRLVQILSDQCKHTIKIAVFADEANTTFKDAKEFGGSVFKQFDDSFAYLMLCNRTTATFKGLERGERTDYPEQALREALLNAIIHRDYSYSGSIIIKVNDTGIEFISIGGLPPGFCADDICSGISQPRNRTLAEIFHRLRLIEFFGTGIRKIYALYQDSAVQPRIEVTTNTFKLVLPNRNADGTVCTSKPEASQKPPVVVTAQMKTVMEHLEQYGDMADEDLLKLLNIKKTRAYLLTRQMSEQGLIDIVGRGDAKKYRLKGS